jgi:hypothetical protein
MASSSLFLHLPSLNLAQNLLQEILVTTTYLFGIVHCKLIAFNCLKVFENSTIWRPLQEDQDRSIPPSFDLEKRTGRRNAFPKAPLVQQESPQVSPHYPSVAYKALVG